MMKANVFILIFVSIFCYNIIEATKCSAHQNNKAIIVHDIKSVQAKLFECCDICKSTPNCKAYTWSDWDGGTCVLKDDVEPVIDLAGVTIGLIEPDTPKTIEPVISQALIKSNHKSKSPPSTSLFTSSNQISLDTPFSGHFTFYKKVGRGACGEQIDAVKQEFAALSFEWFTKAKIPKDPLCNYCLEINYNGKTITVPINDRCPFCPRDQVYLSYKAFTSLQDPSDVGTVYGATFIIVQCDE